MGAKATMEVNKEEKIKVRIVELESPILAGNPRHTWQKFLDVVNKLGVTVINSSYHEFPNGAMTGLILIAESHAAIHTWPENWYAWCELATCGDPTVCDKFEQLLQDWVK